MPGLAGGVAALVPLQPIVAPIEVAINSRASRVGFLRLLMGNPNNSRDTMAIAESPIAMLSGRCGLRLTGYPPRVLL